MKLPNCRPLLALVLAWMRHSSGDPKARPHAGAKDPERAPRIHIRYRTTVEEWAKSVGFSTVEQERMDAGQQFEAMMTRGPDDPIAKKILASGEPNFESVAR